MTGSGGSWDRPEAAGTMGRGCREEERTVAEKRERERERRQGDGEREREKVGKRQTGRRTLCL